MASLLKRAVASPRKQHKDGAVTLDLAYITPTLIVTSMPTSDYLKSWYRTNVNELQSFLQRNHGQHWRIYNFRAEKSGQYKDSEFYGRVSHFPFSDHHPPPFHMIPKFVDTLNKYLKLYEGNVAVLHCKAGQGRSGTMACAYLMVYEGYTRDDAVSLFTYKRMRSGFGNGVSIYSQLRYLGYVAQWTENGRKYDADKIVEIRCIRLYDNQYSDLDIRCNSVGVRSKQIETRYVFKDTDVIANSPSVTIFKPSNFQLCMGPDIQFTFGHHSKFRPKKLIPGIPHSTSYVWFNTDFETEPGHSEGTFSAIWEELDGFIGTHKKGTKCFSRFEVDWTVIGVEDHDSNAGA